MTENAAPFTILSRVKHILEGLHFSFTLLSPIDGPKLDDLLGQEDKIFNVSIWQGGERVFVGFDLYEDDPVCTFKQLLEFEKLVLECQVLSSFAGWMHYHGRHRIHLETIRKFQSSLANQN